MAVRLPVVRVASSLKAEAGCGSNAGVELSGVCSLPTTTARSLQQLSVFCWSLDCLICVRVNQLAHLLACTDPV